MKLQKQLTAALAGAAFFGSVANAEILPESTFSVHLL
jgi:hypothetical protein